MTMPWFCRRLKRGNDNRLQSLERAMPFLKTRIGASSIELFGKVDRWTVARRYPEFRRRHVRPGVGGGVSSVPGYIVAEETDIVGLAWEVDAARFKPLSAGREAGVIAIADFRSNNRGHHQRVV